MFTHVTALYSLVMSWQNEKTQKSGFVHSIKVPKIYKTAAKVVETVVQGGGGLKQVFYSTAKTVSVFLTLLA